MSACPFKLCDGSGFILDEETRTAFDCRCRAQRQSRARARALSAVIPRRYRGVSFDRAPVSDIARSAPHVVQEVRRFAEDIDASLDAGRGLWLMGDVGTGKTTLAMLVSKAALDAGRSVAIYSLPRLLSEIRATFSADSDGSYVSLLERLVEVDLLHIDDVGAEKTSEWVLEALYSIVDGRYEAERAIVVTTNLAQDELADQITPRTVSRLAEMCGGEPLPLFGPDARQRLEPVGVGTWTDSSSVGPIPGTS